MSRIAENIDQIKKELPETTQLIVVSKYREIQEIQDAYNAGQRVFAENRVQALLERKELLPPDICWHLIGHLQTNKVKYIAPFIEMIHSVDSLKLLREINRQAAACNRVIKVLIQVHVAQEESKFGIPPRMLNDFWNEFQREKDSFNNVVICGMMGMASLTENEKQISEEFSQIHELFRDAKSHFFSQANEFKELSIGMSSDYKIATAHGSTLVRVGSKVFS